jgi:transcriptional regulator with XRE-family HTH domain
MNASTPAEIQSALGHRMRALRLRRNLSQGYVAQKTGLSRSAIVNLEHGKNPSLVTLISVLSALGEVRSLDAIAPNQEGPSPIEIFNKTPERQRAGRPRANWGPSS